MEERINELKAICFKHPRTIPISEAADFLGMKAETLRAAINCGTVPFAFRYEGEYGRKNYIIPTITFYEWITKGEVK